MSRDRSITKVDSAHAPRGRQGQKYLASSIHVAMRLWEAERPGDYAESERDYEIVGYVLSGRATLHIEGQMVALDPGDSYAIPRGARHSYTILESFSAVEATSPPAYVHARDERTSTEAGLEHVQQPPHG